MFENNDLYLFLKGRKLKFWKHRSLRKLRKYLNELEEPYNYPFAQPYCTLLALIELQKQYCYLCGYNAYDIRCLKEQLKKEK